VNQLELPQLSLERYVDLVRRRRWQLLPISLLGLIVGGLVAFFIPRYYVAEALIEHKAGPGQLDVRPGVEDPFGTVVANAQDTLRLSVGDAMRVLRWPEATVADPSERTANEKRVQERVDIQDKNAQQRNRGYALIRLIYRDRDGDRAATFANTLATTWIERQLADMRTLAQADLRRASEVASSIGRTWEQYGKDKAEIARRYDIRPDFEVGVQQLTLPQQVQQNRADLAQLQLLRAERRGIAERIARDRDRLLTLPDRIEPDLATIAALLKDRPEFQFVLLMREKKRSALQNAEPGHKKWHAAKREVDEWDEKLRAVLVLVGANLDGTLPNADHVKLQQSLDEDTLKLVTLDARIEQLAATAEAEHERLESLRDGYELLAAIDAKIAECKQQRQDANAAVDAAQATLNRVNQASPITLFQRAEVPPHPTDPNIVLVALIGCVLGLGVAVGLILLLDVLQGTFKTVDDVERGLQVPVLGGLSHLETAEERLAAARSRRRAAAAAFGFVGLVVVVVTIFYVAPTRLPAIVRDLLALLLGT
jgi:hypothetical protein